MKKRISALWRRLVAYWPTPLPQTPAEHQSWVKSVIELGKDLPLNDSFIQAVSTMVLHLGPTVNRKPKIFFLKALEKSISNQVAYQAIDDIKQREKAAKADGQVLENQVVS